MKGLHLVRYFSRDDRGATLVTVAILLVVLVGAAAFAVDLGLAWNERRQDQTSSDLAAVAGALSYGLGGDAVADEVMAVARQDLDSTYSDAEWDAMWQACTDPDRPPGFTPVTHSTLGTLDCISLNPSFVRVRLPDQTVNTAFGSVLGLDTIVVSADTIVTVGALGGGGAFPYAILGNATPGEVCLDTSSGNNSGNKPGDPLCGKNDKGSFGNIAPPQFGNEELGTSPGCGFGQQNSWKYLAESIALGIDHWIFAFPQGKLVDPLGNPNDNTIDSVANRDECVDVGATPAKAADGSPINAVWVGTGNSTKADNTEGLITGTFSGGVGGRLTQGSGTKIQVKEAGNGEDYQLDNVPLWTYLMSGGPGACDKDGYATLTLDLQNELMRDCLENYNPASGIIFDDLIASSPRLGLAPRLWRNNLGSGTSLREVQGFEVVFLARLWFKDDTVFYPGETGTVLIAKNKYEVDKVTAFLLDPKMVSAEVHGVLGGIITDAYQPEIVE